MQAPTREARPLSVVDYDAWNRGYIPPSEHVLIDQLSYRGARVIMSFDWGDAGAVWIVTRGQKILGHDARRKIVDLVHDALEMQLGPGSESATDLAQSDTSAPARELSAESTKADKD